MAEVVNFLDTNIIVYALSEDSKALVAQSLLLEPFAMSVQALNEFANVGRKKLNLSWPEIESAVDALTTMAATISSLNLSTTKGAIDLAKRYNLAFYDATMLSAALAMGCTRYYSEDLQHGLIIDGRMTVINPFL
ncbi:PIN domain-containing protein [Rhizobium sp. S96]|uniref:PIN domain-containing protein n=1 Tax=Rhizobium sp. S96 TaxID=3055140 RepID=UPI0025AA83E7|nr:PIN domain-containing protein [Rhizobium sp. S96]MDM9623752.1 PIN domain-containing protein [Rhizobium sp. S96]